MNVFKKFVMHWELRDIEIKMNNFFKTSPIAKHFVSAPKLHVSKTSKIQRTENMGSALLSLLNILQLYTFAPTNQELFKAKFRQ